MQSIVGQLDLTQAVTFLGVKPRPQVAKILRHSADLLVLPSKAETFGCVLIEALATGLPVVATRCGGPEDIVTHDALGELCPPDDVNALAQAMLRVIEKLPTYDSDAIAAEQRRLRL